MRATVMWYTPLDNYTLHLIQALAANGYVKSDSSSKQVLTNLALDYVESDGVIQLQQSLELLSDEKILAELATSIRPLVSKIDIHTSIESTNTHLMSCIKDEAFSGHVCLAESQTAGRGRRGRAWISPFGRNVYMSLGWLLPQGIKPAGLSLIVGMQVVGLLRGMGVSDVSLKWPNDVLRVTAGRAGKLAGILIELGAPTAKGTPLIIGVGLNVDLGVEASSQIDQPYETLSEFKLSRNALVSGLLTRLLPALSNFSQTGFCIQASEWAEVNFYSGKQVQISLGEDIIRGVDRGVDEFGNIRIETQDGLKSFNAGEVSLRPI
jgi:BirA family biotin operon repressor/biotin-[acetyl-CoA-carboxylase] ligase